jgi:hypothetical protein
MKRLFLALLLMTTEINTYATSVYASGFGWNANNATSAFQAAINSSADTIIIDKQSGDWIVGPNIFFDLYDKTLIFQPGVVLKAKTGAYPENGDCLLKFVRTNNIKIIGYGATFQMNKAEYAAMADGEWRHSLSINNSSNIEVYGLRLNGSGGDGVDISGDPWYGEQLYSENIVLKDLWCDNHYRQGISVISAQHLLVKNCWFTNTSGTLPMSGVDLEPDKDFHRMVDVVFDKCRFTGNSGNGIQLSFHNLSIASVPVDVTFRDCYLSENHDVSNPYAAAEINISAADREAVTGNAKFERCLVENSQWTAVSMRKPADSFSASFDDCVFLDVSKDITNFYNTPIWIEVTDYSNPCPRFGGAVFNDCLLSYNTALNFLGSYGEINTSPGMGNVKLNNLIVVNPKSSVTINVTDGGGSPDATCTFDFHKYTATPATAVSFTAQNRIIECSDKNSILESSRTADNVNFPVAISYSIDGTALQGEDFVRLNGFMIIPANLVSQSDTIFVLKDEYGEELKSMIAVLNTSPLFTTSSFPQTITVWDCTTGLSDIAIEEIFTVFPNPTYNYLEIRFTDYYTGSIQVMNKLGQTVLSLKGQGKTNRINTSGLAKSIYFIKIQTKDRIHLKKIIKL